MYNHEALNSLQVLYDKTYATSMATVVVNLSIKTFRIKDKQQMISIGTKL